jgi:hypothetical protein
MEAYADNGPMNVVDRCVICVALLASGCGAQLPFPSGIYDVTATAAPAQCGGADIIDRTKPFATVSVDDDGSLATVDAPALTGMIPGGFNSIPQPFELRPSERIAMHDGDTLAVSPFIGPGAPLTCSASRTAARSLDVVAVGADGFVLSGAQRLLVVVTGEETFDCGEPVDCHADVEARFVLRGACPARCITGRAFEPLSLGCGC